MACQIKFNKTCKSSHPDSNLIQSVAGRDVSLVTNSDDSTIKLYQIIEEGLPGRRDDRPVEIRQFFKSRNDLSCFDNVILYRDRVVIRHSLCASVLQSLHSAHQGAFQMTYRAESSFFWPGMTPETIDFREHFQECNRNWLTNSVLLRDGKGVALPWTPYEWRFDKGIVLQFSLDMIFTLDGQMILLAFNHNELLLLFIL